MATIQDLERKHSRFVASLDEIVDTLASYGVDITKETPFQQFAGLVKEAVATKLAGIFDGLTEFDLDERDFEKIAAIEKTPAIRRYAFYQNAAVKNVVFPEWITSISNNAFYGCTGLVTVRLKGNSSIQAGVFNGCTNLERFYLPDVTSVAEVPILANVSAFTGINPACKFIAPKEEALAFYAEATNWSTLFDSYEFTFEGAIE